MIDASYHTDDDRGAGFGIGAAGAYGSAKVVDKVQSARTGEESAVATDAMKKVLPMAAEISMLSATPGLAVMAPSALRGIGAGIHTTRYGDRIMNTISQVPDFVGGAVVPGPPAMTKAGALGGIVGRIYDEYWRK